MRAGARPPRPLFVTRPARAVRSGLPLSGRWTGLLAVIADKEKELRWSHAKPARGDFFTGAAEAGPTGTLGYTGN